jgi:hypothetical protein
MFSRNSGLLLISFWISSFVFRAEVSKVVGVTDEEAEAMVGGAGRDVSFLV